MTQRVRVLLIAAALAMPVLARAQTAKHPDFNGSWRITNIDMPEVAAGGYGGGGNRGGYGGRGGFGGRGGRGSGGARRGGDAAGGDAADNGARADRAPRRPEVGQTVHIRQTDDRLIITEDDQGGGVMSSYALDGKESTNRTGDATAKSKTRWEGVALVTDVTRSMNTPRGNFDMKSREVRSLSDDGRAMTVRMELDTPRGKQAMTVTYEKVAD